MKNDFPSFFRSTQSDFRSLEPEHSPGKISVNEPSKSERIFVPPYDKNSPSSKNHQEAEDLFSAFTANIIKKDTLFIR